ncbi:MAG: hypothetical protein ACK50R_01000, partial [Planctomycetota bacterium]
SDRFEQHWECVGISPIHRALIRRLAISSLQKHHGKDHRIVWTSDSPHIRWIDSNLFLEGLGSLDHGSMQILWCWNEPNWRDFLAATPWTITGVVYNLATLKSWISRCVLLGKWQAAQGKSLPSIELSS